jgi:hypothetical protein
VIGEVETTAPQTLIDSIRTHFSVPPCHETTPHHLQRLWSRMLDDDQQPSTDLRTRARLSSCSASHLALHPIIEPGGEDFEWLQNQQMVTTARLRLGLPIYAADTDCCMCRQSSVSDNMGRHSLACMSGGFRTRLHHGARDDLVRLAAMALANPRTEAACFPDAPGRRCDLLLQGHTHRGRACALDYACITHTDARLRTAAETQGGAATAYEATKRADYEALADSAGLHFVPMIQDIYGAWGQSAKPIIKQLSRRIADRTGDHRAGTHRRTQMKLLVRHMRRIADILLNNL